MRPGTRIDYRLRVRGIPIRWQSVIEEWCPGESFVDTQSRGPYSQWHHTHLFEPMAGGTLLVDIVRYRVPGGLPGSLMAGAWVARDIEAIFSFRRDRIREAFGE